MKQSERLISRTRWNFTHWVNKQLWQLITICGNAFLNIKSEKPCVPAILHRALFIVHIGIKQSGDV